MFWVSLVAALATLVAVGVAVTDSITANRRAERAEARQQTIDEENIRRRDEDLRIEKARIKADLEKYEYWLSVAKSYQDQLRQAELEMQVLAARTRLDQITRALGEMTQ